MACVDIIVPAYNVEKYIEECMESILSQTYDDFRIILVDDGSTDQSGLICDKYALLHSKIVVKHKKNGGISSARNVGLSMVEAPYFMFVDSDDFIHRDTLRYLLYIAETENVDVVKYGITMTGKNGVPEEAVQFSSGGEVPYQIETQKKDWVYTFGHATSKLYKTQIVKNISFPEGLIYEDYYYSAVVASLVKRIAETPVRLYYYRENPQSITHTLHDSHRDDKFRIYNKISEYYKENGIYEEYREELEYLYIQFCFINACKIAVVSYREPYQFVRECVLRIKEKYPRFQNNRIFRQRSTPIVRMMACLIFISPVAFVLLSKTAIMMKKDE